MQSQPQPILCKAAVAYGPKQPLKYENIWVDAPKQGEVRIKVISNALCHTDIYTLDGCDPEGKFPCILGHEATAVVESVGKGVTKVKVGDIVIPCYTPQCMERECIYCSHPSSNLCPKIRSTQGIGLMPDKTSRFLTQDKKNVIYHFMGCSTFSEYTVIAEISAAKINPHADLNKVCMIGCGVATGWGAVMNNTNIESGKTVAVWGLGAVGLSVIQAAKIRGASKIYAIDINPKKFDAAKGFGADVCYQPTPEKNAKAFLIENEKWGIDYTYDCTGNVNIMREALESAHRGWGQSCVIGVAESGKEIATRSFQLVTGRKWLGTAFGGWKSNEDVPKLVNKASLGQWPIEKYVTHEIEGLEKVNDAIDILHQGECLRAVVKISAAPDCEKIDIKITEPKKKLFGGSLYKVTHWSKSCSSFMNFNIYIPDENISEQRGEPYPVIYCLSGLSCTEDNFAMKSGFGEAARQHRIAMVFPDTSPRNTNIPGVGDHWEHGNSASYYVDCSSENYKKHFQMYTYITEELPQIVSTFFPVSLHNRSITGFSMGGHGSLMCTLKSGKYKSVSAFSPISNPTKSERWGISGYKLFFEDWEKQGKEWDTTALIESGHKFEVPVLIEVGSEDKWKDQIMVPNLVDALEGAKADYIFKNRAGYGHDFFYVSTFIREHIEFHARFLRTSWK